MITQWEDTKPATYPHSAERYAADVARANECLSRSLGRDYRVIVRQESLHREIGYRIQAVSDRAARGQAKLVARDLGYTLISVDSIS